VIKITVQGHPVVQSNQRIWSSLEGHGPAPVVPGFASTGLPVSGTVGMEALVQVLIPGSVLALAPLAMTISIITLSAIAEPAIAGDSTRSMPTNREGGGSRDACQVRRLVHLVPITDRLSCEQGGGLVRASRPQPPASACSGMDVCHGHRR